jgi:hypothetical protein
MESPTVYAPETGAPEPTFANHVPGEVCLVVWDPAFDQRHFTGGRTLDGYGDALYQNVLAFMNRIISSTRLPVPNDQEVKASQVARVDRMGRTPLERDLTPTADFQTYFGLGREDRPVLRPLTDSRARARPWMLLPREQGATTLCFFAIGPAELHPTDPKELTSPEARRNRALPIHQTRVREFVKLLNWKMLPQTELPGLGGLSITAATPNWLTVPTHSHGSPGTLPQRVTPVEQKHLGSGEVGRFTFRFVEGRLYRKLARQNGRGDVEELRRLLTQQDLDTLVERLRLPAAEPGNVPNVVVAVLDTSPTREQVRQRADLCPDNALLNEVADEVDTPGSEVQIEPNRLPASAFLHLAGFRPNLKEHLSSSVAAPVADHGLFVAGIIHDIAPRAKVRLIRVLDDNGVGDLVALLNVLHRLPSEVEPGTRLIINLSLVADLPTADQLLELWFPHTYRSPKALRASWRMIAAMLNLTHLCLEEVINWLHAKDVLVVAATGNAAFDPAIRPEPLYPAAYDTVFGVASVTRGDEPSMYSNRGDVRVFGNGVGVFGGQGIAASEDELPTIPKAGRDGWRDAVAGIFSADTIPLAPTTSAANETGWVWWSGTSFATPVVTAIAADLLLDPPTSGLSVPALMKTIRDFATIPEFALEGRGPFDCSAIYARQVWKSD